IDAQAFHLALDEIWLVVRNANRAIDEDAPWTLRKTDEVAMGHVLYTLCEIIRHLAVVLLPFIPESSGKLLDQLAVPADKRDFAALEQTLAPGTTLPKPEGVFPRYVEAETS
ncbi:MAG: methionine--tRNA ligase, partial [Alphaproteobacteria bacterium]